MLRMAPNARRVLQRHLPQRLRMWRPRLPPPAVDGPARVPALLALLVLLPGPALALAPVSTRVVVAARGPLRRLQIP
jgi:hypothetical protein